MKRTRTAKRYDDTIQPGAFDGFQAETIQTATGEVCSLVRREGGRVQLGRMEAARSAAPARASSAFAPRPSCWRTASPTWASAWRSWTTTAGACSSSSAACPPER